MTIHLNADAPNVNDVPTLHTLEYITLAEYCRLAGLSIEEVELDLANDNSITFGGPTTTLIYADQLAARLEHRLPDSLLRRVTLVFLS